MKVQKKIRWRPDCRCWHGGSIRWRPNNWTGERSTKWISDWGKYTRWWSTVDLERDYLVEDSTTDLEVEDLAVKDSKINAVDLKIEDHQEGGSTIDPNDAL